MGFYQIYGLQLEMLRKIDAIERILEELKNDRKKILDPRIGKIKARAKTEIEEGVERSEPNSKQEEGQSGDDG